MLQKLDHILASLSGFTPEVWLVVAFVGIITWDLIAPEVHAESRGGFFHGLTFLAFAFLGVLLVQQWQVQPRGVLFGSMLRLDDRAIFFKLLVTLTALVTVLHSWVTGRRWSGEFFSVLIGTVFGLLVLSMATNLLMVYLSLEVVSISSYILTALRGDRKSSEGGMKYVLFGSVASALMLYGMSLLYGLTSTLDFTNPSFSRALLETDPLVSASAVLLAISGLLFKVSAVPFQVWNPDVYEAADTPVVSFFSVAPKAVAFLVLMRLFSVLPLNFQPVLAVLSLATITVGNFSALWQTEAKRLMAYSSIAQSGFVLVGLVAFSELGQQTATFYLGSYVFASMACFLLIDILSTSRSKNEVPIQSFSGVGRQQPLPAILLSIAFISLVGLPLTVGFSAKLLIFSSLWEAYQHTNASLFLVLFVFGLLNTAVSLAFYVKIPYALFFKTAEPGQSVVLPRWPQVILALVLVIPIIALFLRTDWLMNWIAGFVS
ncbi:NADH-quinone oxidoreductase subunit N [Siphonobacter sp. BAB-5385]|uniref:NADH-quinone oxidoreductase subunit N n=1 Tax=Siphonobacter sp. BAB-5385 TaxID=1864822 RepID=UPI000B9E5D08|nr:NADH-quinone oxidoreductase subunit N [Siphonobacter sp. BAB-5385]OZI06665.1 NADH-quinone oxidoreductase subunit N [Siphonobacter sp. BAB-5385]